jgi:hypothetical protein
MIVLTQIMYFIPHPLNVAWMSLNARNSEERAVAMAMIIMAANMAGIYANQLFRADDKPRYRRGLSVNVALLVGALGFAVFQGLFIWHKKKRAQRQEETRGIVSPPESISDSKSTPPLSPSV